MEKYITLFSALLPHVEFNPKQNCAFAFVLKVRDAIKHVQHTCTSNTVRDYAQSVLDLIGELNINNLYDISCSLSRLLKQLLFLMLTEDGIDVNIEDVIKG